MLGQATSRGEVLRGVQEHGLAPGARRMIDWEEEAADEAMRTGIYGVYRSSKQQDCTRIGPSSRCFCGHLYSSHTFLSQRAAYPRCQDCACGAFRFIPSRPEEVGEWWLVRRKGFNVHTWRAKCRCGHPHDEHNPQTMRCRCGCSHFQSNFACLVCDKKWEDHETVFESAQERLADGRAIGEAYRPLAGDAQIREHVFSPASMHRSAQPSRVRPAPVPAHRAEKSVRIMHETSGGRVRGQQVANRYGKVSSVPDTQQYVTDHTAAGSYIGAAGVHDELSYGRASQQTSSGMTTGLEARLGTLQIAQETGTVTSSSGNRDMRRGVANEGKSATTLASGFRPVYD